MRFSLSWFRSHGVLITAALLVALVWALARPCIVNAQPPDPIFEHVFDLGAPGLQVFHQDRHGFLWIGSRGGLFRYDGYELKRYDAGPGQLSNGYIYGLVEDPLDPNIFWVGTKGGLDRFDRQTETYTYYRHDPDDPDSLSNDGINQILQDGQDPNLLWVASDGGLDLFDKQAGTFTHYRPDPDKPDGLLCPQIWRMVEDSADPNLLWIGTWGCGFYQFDKRTETFTRYLHDPDDPHSLGAEDNLVSALAQDKDDPNLLWIGTIDYGLNLFDQRTGQFTHYVYDPQNPTSITPGIIGLIYDDGDGRLWMGGWSFDNGLTLLDKASGEFTNYTHDPGDPLSLREDMVINVYEDQSGIFWIVTMSGHVSKIDPHRQTIDLYQNNPNDPDSLINDAVTFIYEDRDRRVWLGTQAGLARFDAETESFVNYAPDPDDPSGLPAPNIWDIQQDAAGDLWISYFPGPLTRFDPQTERVVAQYREGQESFFEMIQDPEDPDLLWVVTRPAGLASFDRGTETFTFYEPHLPNTEGSIDTPFLYVGIHDRQDDLLWLGGWEGGGLVRFDKKTGDFTRYLVGPDDPQNLYSDVIATIYQDETGLLWIGTFSGGLETFDKSTETFTHYTQTHGVPATVYGILEVEDGTLWLSTNNGIVQFNPQTEEVERQYTKADGLQGDNFLPNSALRSSDGSLWFGGTNGVNRFDPDEFTVNPYVPPVVLTSFTQGGEPIRSDVAPENLSEVRLDWRHNFFEFEYAALNYTQPERNRYAYMLEGMDWEWYEAGTRRFGRYTGLRGGSYLLRIKGANNDGVWNEEGVTVRVIVESPFWQTWWFYALCAVGVLGVFGVIYQARTQQLRAEREAARTLRESEERLRRVVQHMPVMMDAFDADGNLLVWNRECERVTGYSAEEMIGNPRAMEHLYPDLDYREQVMTTWEEREQDIRSWETEVACRDGSVRTIAWSNISRQFPIPGWDEWAIGVDVTERKRAEQEQVRMLKRVQQIIATVPEGVLLLGAEGCIRVANPEAERCLAILAGAQVGDTITHLGDSSLETLLTSPPTTGLWHEVKAGKRIFEIIARPMANGSQLEDWVMVLRDVTQEREVESRLQQQDRLAAVGQLAAGIAHDFNNIMATIILYAQMAERAAGLSDQGRQQMRTIDQQAKHASRLIQQILDFSRRAVIDRQPLDLLPLAQEVVEMLGRTLPENIRLELVHDAEEYIVDADPTRMQQMLTNLALNARDAMVQVEEGQLTISLQSVHVEDRKDAPLPEMKDGDWIEVQVSDTGVGIKPDVLPHIFEPFFTTKAPGEGSGLGLPQVHGIVGTHEGHIAVQSQPNNGTCFTVYLPAASSPSESPRPVSRPTSEAGQGEVILVVEDDSRARQAIQESLELLNYSPLTAASGREALGMLEQCQDEVALVLSDVVMPDLGGIALVHAMRERRIPTAVVLMTGHPLEQSLDDLKAYHVVDLISKPISLDRLAQVVARGLQDG